MWSRYSFFMEINLVLINNEKFNIPYISLHFFFNHGKNHNNYTAPNYNQVYKKID